MIFPYLLCLLGLVVNEALFPQVHLFVFAPFLALLVIRKQLLASLWLGALSGLTLDLLSSNFRFGLYATSFLATILAIYKLKNLFFEEKAHALAVFSVLVAMVFTVIEASLLSFFGHLPPFTLKTLTIDFLILPLFDGLFSFFWFSMPFKVYKKGRVLWLLKRRS